MAILTLTILITLLILAYFGGKRKFLSPWFLLCAMTSVSFLLVLFNYQNWEVHINGRFILYISAALLAFGAGTALWNSLQKKQITVAEPLPLETVRYTRKYPVDLFLILSCLLAVGYIGKLFIDVDGFSLPFSAALRKIYDSVSNENYSPGILFNQMSEIVLAIAYINTFRLLLKIFNKKGSNKDNISYIKLLIPILVAFIMTLISTDRNIFLRYGIYFICLWMLFYYNNCKTKHANFKIVLGVGVAVAVAAVLFFFMGKMKQYASDFTRMMSIYGGSGLYNFNLWIAEYDAAPMWGASTFTQFLGTLGVFFKPFGIDLHGTVNRIDPFIQYTAANGYEYSSNIYTALKPFVEDFGFLGVLIFPFAMGVFYQWLYRKTQKSKYGMWWLLYCILIYPVLFFPILEQLFRRLHLGMLYEIAWPLILYCLVFKIRGFRVRKRRVVAAGKGVQ